MDKSVAVVKLEMYHFETFVQTFKLIDIYHHPARWRWRTFRNAPTLPELNLQENVFPTFMSPSGWIVITFVKVICKSGV